MEMNELASKVAHRTLELAFKYSEDETYGVANAWEWFLWDWNMGVAFFGLWQVNDVLHNQVFIDQMRQWIDSRIEGGIQALNVNTCAPLTTVLRLNKLYPSQKYERLCQKFDDYIFNQVPHTPCGAIAHTTLRSQNLGKVWADTLFMCVLYLAQRGLELKDPRYLDEVIRQMELHFQVLVDPETGLLYHGWDDDNRKFIGERWGRGNAWVTVSTIEILQGIGRDFPQKQKFLEIIDRQLAAFEKYQDASGFWHTVIDHPETYLETSVTAGVAYGVLKGVRLGMVDRRYLPMAQRAMQAFMTNIDAQGTVLKGSGGTGVKPSPVEYNEVPYVVTPFTQGLGLMALSEQLSR